MGFDSGNEQPLQVCWSWKSKKIYAHIYQNRWFSVNNYKGFWWALFNCIKHLAKFVIFADFNRNLTLDEMSYILPQYAIR